MVVDILALVVMLISAVISFLRGFIREILTILGTVGALAAAYFGGPHFTPIVHGWLGVLPDEQPKKLFGMLPYDLLGTILAYGGIFIVVIIVLSIISHILAETAKSLGLGAVDRTLGVIFGFARGLVLLGLLYLPVHLMVAPETKQEWFEGSKTHFYIEKTAGLMSQFLPESTVDDIEEKVEDGAASTREKLENMNILQKEGAQQIEGEKKNAPGYTEEFRDNMDRLFEEKTDNERKLND
ncbi:MAG: colicin V biosynthesis protein [Micavibrio sp.]|nr:MAG: colicin V biosynthesis protein [Micavibrio sp.]